MNIKSIVIVALVAALPGCVTYPGYDIPPPSDADREYCRYEVLKATASGPGGSVGNEYLAANTIANDLATGMRQGELMGLCLRQRRLNTP